MEPSYENHYFKTHSSVTTAAYKPLSLLATLNKQGILDLDTTHMSFVWKMGQAVIH